MPMPLSGLAQTLSNSVAKVQADIVDTQNQLSAGVKNLNPGQNGVVTRLSAQADGYTQVMTNIGTAQSVISVGQGALGSIAAILTQMKSLATQAQSAGLTTADAASMNATFTNLAAQISTLKTGASVNGNNLLSGGSIAVTTGIDGTSSSNTTITGVDVGSVATTAGSLSIGQTSSSPIATISTTTTATNPAVAGISATTGTAAVDTYNLGNGSNLAAGTTVIIGGTLTFTVGTGTPTGTQVANAIASFINYGTISNSAVIAAAGTPIADIATSPSKISDKYTASVDGSGNLVLTQKSGNYGASTVTIGGTATSLKTNTTVGVASSAGSAAQDFVTFNGSAGTSLTSGQSVTVGGLTFTANQTVTGIQAAAAFYDYIRTSGGTPGTLGSWSGNTGSTLYNLYTATTVNDASNNAAVLKLVGKNNGPSALAVSGGTSAANAQAAVVSLTTLLNTVSTGQSTLSAAATGLTAQTANANALKTGLTNTVNSIQNIDATAMQAKLQQLNNQQSIDYYLVSQMNTEAAAILSIFR